MENEQFNKDIQAIRTIVMTPEEKKRVLMNVLQEVPEKETSGSVRARLFDLLFSRHSLSIALLPLLIVLVAGTGTAIAAENAVPGDLLYPVKTSVTERVFDALAFGNTAQAMRAAQKAERRLQEAETLAAKGRLDSGNLESLLTRFEEHTQTFEDRITRTTENAGETLLKVRLRFEAALAAHGLVLEKIGPRVSPEVQKGISVLELTVKGKSVVVEGATSVDILSDASTVMQSSAPKQAGITAQEAVKASPEMARLQKKRAQLQKQIAETARKLDPISPETSAFSKDLKSTAHTLLSDATRAVDQAAVEEQVGDFEEAYTILHTGAREAEKARIVSEQEKQLRKYGR
ncbi:MAG: DUF5667 domain-containing protein [bacterium]|nr:DUF5667 domain-containing protein [bacterium]